MLKAALPGLLAISALLDAGDTMRIGIRLQTPPTMSSALIQALIHETERRWNFPSLDFHWHHDDASCDGMDNRLLIVRLRGSASLLRPARREAASPLGFTHVSNDKVLPFIEIDCESVAASLWRRTPASAVFLNSGRYAHALAAVLTHEMVHALTASRQHDRTGIMRSELGPEDLVGYDLGFGPTTIDNLESALRVQLAESGSR